MAARNEAKVKEGTKHMTIGDKCLQTGLFKWKPDYEGAAAAFKEAGNCFRVARAHEDAKSAFVKAGKALDSIGSDFHAAKHYEQAAMMAKELKQGEEAAHWFEIAGQLFRQNGSVDTAGIMLDRAGKILEPLDGSKALKMYCDSAELSEDSDKFRQAAESLTKAVQLMVKYRKFEDCVKAMEHQLVLYDQLGNHQHMHKVCLSIILIQLCRDDEVAAERCMRNSCGIDGFSESDAAALGEELMQAYDSGDEEAMEKVTSDQYFSFISTEIARLARCLKGPQDLAPPDASLNQPKASSMPSYTKTSSSAASRPAPVKRTPVRAAEDRAALFGEAPPPVVSASASSSSSAATSTSSRATAVPAAERAQPRASAAKKPADTADDRAALFGDPDDKPSSRSKTSQSRVEDAPPAEMSSRQRDASPAGKTSPAPEPTSEATGEPASAASEPAGPPDTAATSEAGNDHSGGSDVGDDDEEEDFR